MPSKTDLYLHPDISLKRLEELYAYNRATDELYELNPAAWDFLAACASGNGIEAPKDLIDYCLEEGILTTAPCPDRRSFPAGQAPRPLLRYLELQVTDRCNSHCLHCYLGEGCHRDLELTTGDLKEGFF